MAPPSPDPEPEVVDEEPPPDAVQPRRRLLPLIVLLGALVVGAPLLDGVGDRRQVVIRLDAPERVTELSLVLRDGGTALWGTERHFEVGDAPGGA